MKKSLGHERELTFFPQGGHNHDGENSSPIELGNGYIKARHLDPALLDMLMGGDGSDDQEESSSGFVPVPDLVIETNAISPGASVTGTATWTGISVVRFMRVVMSVDTECTITFYHLPTFAEEDREFRARRCSNKFLWEGPWVHYDEALERKIYYKVENTGLSAAQFQLTLKAGTLVANEYAEFVSSLKVAGQETGLVGAVTLVPGAGMSMTQGTDGTITMHAGGAETIPLQRWALSPQKHVSITSSAAITTTSAGLNAQGGVTSYVGFGTGLQWLMADFGAVYNTGRITAQGYCDGRILQSVKIEGSFDGTTWTEYLSAPTAMQTIGAPMTVEIPAGASIRYLRFWSNGNNVNTGNHLSMLTLHSISNKVGS